MAVLISGLTTIVGFGGLMMANHRGIFGLGLLLTLGSTMSLIAALVVLPVLLRMVQQMRDARGARREAETAAPGFRPNLPKRLAPSPYEALMLARLTRLHPFQTPKPALASSSRRLFRAWQLSLPRDYDDRPQ